MKVDGTNLSMIRGDSEAITVILTDKDDIKIALVDGKDMIYFTVKPNTSVVTPLIQIIRETFEDGEAIIDIEPHLTSSLPYKNFVYDIQWVDKVNKKVTTVVPASIFKIEPEVTFEGLPGKVNP